MTGLFRLAATIVSLYSILCFIRIIITWIPNARYSGFAAFLSAICDPYLNVFRKIPLSIGSIDFSPAIALCVLGGASSILGGIANGGRLSIGVILGVALQTLLSIVNSLITFVIIIFVIRLIVVCFNKDENYSSSFMMNQIDSSISPFVYRIAKVFASGPLSYKKALIIAIITMILMNLLLTVVFGILVGILTSLPF